MMDVFGSVGSSALGWVPGGYFFYRLRTSGSGSGQVSHPLCHFIPADDIIIQFRIPCSRMSDGIIVRGQLSQYCVVSKKSKIK